MRTVAGWSWRFPSVGIACRALLASAALFLVACTSDESERDVEPSGFLGDYSQLEPGKGDQPLLVYISPSADFFSYDRILIDPVTVWQRRGSSLENASDAELRELVSRLAAAMRARLQASIFEIVEEPGPHVLRIRAAITEARGAEKRIHIESLPPRAIVTGTAKLGTDTHAFVGRAAMELEVVDALTNERLAAAVDERLVAAVGERAFEKTDGQTAGWSDVEAAFDFWATKLAAVLTALHQFGDPDPEEEASDPGAG